MSSEGRRLAVGTGWTLLSTLVALAVSAILSPIIVLYVGVGGYGVWAAAIAIGSLFALGGDLGVAGALTKFTAERQGRHEDLGTMPGNALVFAVLAGCVAGGLLLVLAPILAWSFAYPDFAVLLQILALQMPINLAIASLLSLRHGRRMFRSLAVVSICMVSGGFGLAMAFLSSGGGIKGVLIASLATSGMSLTALIAAHSQELRFGGLTALRSDFKILVPFGVKLTVANAFSTVLYHLDLVILAFLVRDPGQLGLYALATFVTRGLWIIPGTIGVTTYPVVSEYSAARRDQGVARYMSNALIASIAVTGVLSVSFVLFGRPAIALVFGSFAATSFDLGLIMLFGTAFLGCLRSVGSALSSVGRPDIGLRISMLGAVLLLLLSITFVTGWGATGAATAVTLSFSVVASILVWSLRQYVLKPQGGTFDSSRAARTGMIAILLVGVSLIFSLPTNPSPESLVFAGLMSTVSTVVLIEASGGWRTWSALMKRTSGDGVNGN